jgi:HD-GYP domain-containing protein (c-di-GMP phosphodiesterase class II)
MIPLGSRVIGTCAEFIALTSDGDKPRTPKQALATLRRLGKQFDPVVLDALAAVHDQLPADLPVAAGA